MKKSLKIAAFSLLASAFVSAGFATLQAVEAQGSTIEVSAPYTVDLTNAKASVQELAYKDGGVEGLYIESDTFYSGKFRKVFHGDATFEYRFPGERIVGSELFVFTITSVSTSQSFDIIYREIPSFQRTQMYVSYNYEGTEYIRTVGTINSVNKPISNINVGSVGQINGYIGDSMSVSTNQMFGIEVVGDVVNVYAKLGNSWVNEEKVLLCSFDGTVEDEYLPDNPALSAEENAQAEETARKNRWTANYDANADESDNKEALIATQNKCFMPKIDFSEGYTISFESNLDNGSEILFLSYDFGDGLKENFWELKNTVSINEASFFNGNIEIQPGGYFGIPLNASDWEVYKKISFTVGDDEWIDKGTYVTEEEIDFDLSIDTTKVATYQTTLGGECVDNPVTVAVIDDVAPSYIMGNVTNATITTDYQKMKISNPSQVNYSGVAIQSDEDKWQGEFSGTFYGDVKLGFRFMGDSGIDTTGNTDGEFSFKIIDAIDENKYYWVSYRVVSVYGADFATVGVKEGGDRPTAIENMFTGHLYGYINATPCGNNNPNNGNFFPGFNSDRIETENAMNILSFKNTKQEGKMSVEASLGYGPAAAKLSTTMEIAKFDGKTTSLQASGLSPLSAMYFPNGYRIEFSTIKSTDICLIELNEQPLNEKLWASANQCKLELQSEYSIDDTTKVEIPLYSDTHGFTVKENVKILGVLDSDVYRNAILSEEINLSSMKQETPITVSYGGRISKVYQISVGGPATRCTWADGIVEVSDYNVGAGINVPIPNKQDIISIEERLEDGSYANVDIVNLEIKVVEPNATEEKSVEEVVFINPGEYSVLYIVPRENEDFSIILKRTINIINEEIPVFTLSGERILLGYVGETILVPRATAVANGIDCEVTVSIGCNNEIVATGKDVTSFVPLEPGEYHISYFATSSANKSNSNSYVVTILLDDIGPTIHIVFEDKTVKPETMVSLPENVTAIDNVDGNVEVTVSVMFGTETVDVVKNRFYAEFIGVYTVSYRAVDSKGNQSIKEYRVTVSDVEVSDNPNHSGNDNSGNSTSDGISITGCNGCGSTLSVGGGTTMAMLGIASLMMLKIKKREEKNNEEKIN